MDNEKHFLALLPAQEARYETKALSAAVQPQKLACADSGSRSCSYQSSLRPGRSTMADQLITQAVWTL